MSEIWRFLCPENTKVGGLQVYSDTLQNMNLQYTEIQAQNEKMHVSYFRLVSKLIPDISSDTRWILF